MIAIFLLTTSLKGVSSMKLHRDLGITQKSAWHLAHRLREAWTEAEAATFGGPIEADETHMGGKRKNMSNAKRKALAGTGRGADRVHRPTSAMPTPSTRWDVWRRDCSGSGFSTTS